MSNRIGSHATHVGQLGHMVNAYLVQEDDGLTLIDGLSGNQSKRILAAATAIGAPIKRIVLTHAHPDHVGAIDALVAQLPDVAFIVGAREARSMGKATLEEGEPTGGKLWAQNTSGIKRAKPTRLVEDGDTIGSLRVIATPGHSLGHISLLDERDGTAFCGDVFSTVNGVATTAGPYLRFPLPGIFTWHRPTELASARTLAALNPQRLCPGHGKTVEQPRAQMEAAVAKRGSAAKATA
jgi:glyoxylase-like metal-dependent hydrolase (beta-lactamase superfamily II)